MVFFPTSNFQRPFLKFFDAYFSVSASLSWRWYIALRVSVTIQYMTS
jgi:hypothetical protein